MQELKNGWKEYWKRRVDSDGEYYGKGGSNADHIIELLEIKKKDIVLDIGCAIGAHLSDIAVKTKAKCYGIDISPIAIDLNEDKRLKLKVADMESTGYKNDFFTKVFTLGVFEHTPRSYNVFKELNRIMKKKGLAYVTVPNKYSFFHVTKNIKMKLGIWDLGYEKSFTKPELKELLEKTGFKVRKYWVAPHKQVANVFNLGDNILNKISNQHLGFFIHMVIEKVNNAE